MQHQSKFFSRKQVGRLSGVVLFEAEGNIVEAVEDQVFVNNIRVDFFTKLDVQSDPNHQLRRYYPKAAAWLLDNKAAAVLQFGEFDNAEFYPISVAQWAKGAPERAKWQVKVKQQEKIERRLMALSVGDQPHYTYPDNYDFFV